MKIIVTLLVVIFAIALPAATLEIKKGDHICLIGNTLAERMQSEGHNHWETMLHQRFPKHHLVARNLAWPADEVALRPRAEGFGTPDEHLTFCKADVVIAFFGFNESFAGEAGLEKFKTDLDEWIKHTKAQSYNGKNAPRIALVSPIAVEDLGDPNLPTGNAIKEMNARVELYTRAMKAVAEKNAVVFADLFGPSSKLYQLHNDEKQSYTPSGILYRSSKWPPPSPPPVFTINGVHLKAMEEWNVALILNDQLFGGLKKALPYATELRDEIESKSYHWYHRYRIVDSYYVYGGRSGLKFADGDQTNRDVMQREREVLDEMVANRDARIWALAEGKRVPEKCDDSNVPPFLEVKTSFGVNRKTDAGVNTGQTSKTAEGDSAEILPSAESLKRFKLAPGYAINLYASTEQFPELGNAVAFAFDPRGRMFVTTMPSYPQWRPGDKMDDKVLILDDSDHDGKADYCTTFASGLQCPIGLEMAKGGVIVNNQREVLFLKDTNGDDKADVKEIILSGFDSADSHHVINAFTYGPGGDLYFQEGTFHHTQVETPYGPVRCKNAGTYRYEPRTQKLDVFVSYNYANPHGMAFDEWGQTFISDASGGANYFATAFSGRLPYPEKHSNMKQFFPKRVRPTAGCEFVSSRNFPDEAQGNFLLNNDIGVQGVLQHKVKAVGSGYEGTEIEPLVLSDDKNFRPVDLQFGPDGALYIVDWQEALVGHMQYSLRDPQRDHKHARIWRVIYKDRPLVKPPVIAGAKIEALLDLLKEPEMRTRERVKQELNTRDTKEVVAAVEKWAVENSNDIHAQLEALWVCQWHNIVNERMLVNLLSSKEHRARAAAVRVLCYQRDRLPDVLGLLKTAANDEHPLVRLEAIRACSFFVRQAASLSVSAGSLPAEEAQAGKLPANTDGQTAHLTAANIALDALKHDMDYYLEYTLGETMRALKPSPKDIDIKANPKALAYVIDRMTNEELKAAPKEEAVFVAQLERKGLDALTRDAAAVELAKLRKTTREIELANVIKTLDERNEDSTASADIGKLLAASPSEALRKAAETIQRMAGKDHGVRSARVAGMAAFVAMLGDPAKIWKEKQDNHETLTVLLESAVLVPDPSLRAKFQPLLIEALNGNQPAQIKKAAIAALPLTGADFAATNFGLLCDSMLKGQISDTAARAAMQLPRAAWDKTKALPVSEGILAHAKTVPANQRTEQSYIEITQFGSELATLLPKGDATRIRKALRELGVSVFVIKTVREQMRYDTPQIIVEAGKPFEVIFENTDVMPHNLVFTEPGKRNDVVAMAMAMTALPNIKGFLYIPPHKAILPDAYTKMLEPGEKTRLQLTAPSQVGDYDYVCTFPGHAVLMYGKMSVVKDVDVP